MKATVPAPLGQPPVFYKHTSSYPWSELKLPLVPPPPTSSTASHGLSACLTLAATLLTLFLA